MFIKYRIVTCSALLILGIFIKELLQPGIYLIITISVFIICLSFIRTNFLILLFLPLGLAATPIHSPSLNINDRNGIRADIKGTLIRNPENRRSSTRIFLELKEIKYNGMIRRADEKIVLYSKFPINDLAAGDILTINDLRLERIKAFKNPGVFDIADHYSRKNIFYSGFINRRNSILRTGVDNNYNQFLRVINNERQKFVNFVRSGIPPPESEIINALSVGEKSLIPKNLRERFTALGISHIFAISGLHIGAVAFFFYKLIKWLLKRSEYLILTVHVQKLSAGLTIWIVVIYAAIAGFSTSSVRASIMICTYLFSIIAGRDENKINSLAFAAILILIAEPYSIYDLSFKLSFSAVLGILLLHNYYPLNVSTLKDKIISGLKVTSAASFCTLPFTVNSFGYLPVSTIPANLLIVPLIEILVMPLSILSISFFRISEYITLGILELDRLIISRVLYLTSLFDSAGMTYYTFPGLDNISLTLFFMLGLCLLFLKKARFPVYIMPCLLSVFLINIYADGLPGRENELTLSYFDSGYKEICLIELPYEKNLMVNGGYSRFSSSPFIEDTVVIPHLLSRGITRLDYLIVTSTDRSHITGLKSLLKKIDVINLWTNGARLDGELWEIIKRKEIRWKDISKETETFVIEGTNFRFFKPRGEFSVWDYRYPLPFIIRIGYGGRYFLMGESISNRYVQKELVETYSDVLKADLAYIPEIRRGPEVSEFIKTSGMEYIICKSCYGKDPGKGVNATIFQTDVSGMIRVTSDGDEISIHEYKKSDI